MRSKILHAAGTKLGGNSQNFCILIRIQQRIGDSVFISRVRIAARSGPIVCTACCDLRVKQCTKMFKIIPRASPNAQPRTKIPERNLKPVHGAILENCTCNTGNSKIHTAATFSEWICRFSASVHVESKHYLLWSSLIASILFTILLSCIFCPSFKSANDKAA